MNSIVIVNIGRDALLDRSLPYIREYCLTHGLDLNIIEDKYYDITVNDSYNYLTFEKNQVVDYLDKYDQVLRIDSDVLVKPDAPNIFDYVPEGSVGGVYEDVRDNKQHRQREIRRLQKNLSKDLNWDEGYINSGVAVAGSFAYKVFDINAEYIKQHSRELGPFKEQSLFNFKVQENHLPVTSLSPRWNRMSMFNNIPKEEAYFIHYAGPSYNEQVKLMEEDIAKLIKD